jgi:hypothetical protein
MHDHVMTRYRSCVEMYEADRLRRLRYPLRQPPKPLGILRQVYLRRVAKRTLSLLVRANEGYTKSLERVLLLSYGRIGRRRHRLLEALLSSEPIPSNTDAVAEFLQAPSRYEDGWEPPAILMELLKAQRHSATVVESGVRKQLKTFEPKIPKENSWGRPVPLCRRRNIRKRWYVAALNSALPPLPESEVNVLRDLLSGAQPWTPVQRRKALLQPAPQETTLLDARFMAEGPKKGLTFRDFTNGRPHHITSRLMRRLWDRIHCLIPYPRKHPVRNSLTFAFPSPRHRETVLAVNEQQVPDLFAGLDEQGRKLPKPPKPKAVRHVT